MRHHHLMHFAKLREGEVLNARRAVLVLEELSRVIHPPEEKVGEICVVLLRSEDSAEVRANQWMR